LEAEVDPALQRGSHSTSPVTRWANGTTEHALPSEEEFVDDARAMVRLYALATAFGGTSEIDEIMQPEGSEPEPGRWDEARKRSLHARIERSRRLAIEAKRIHGDRCQVCTVRFSDIYGVIGDGYIEAHHQHRS
jgi:5-methylcytosine-specific restriction protein A